MTELFNILVAESSGAAAVSVSDVMVRLLMAFLSGLAVAWVYRASHSTLNYSQNFVQAMVLLSMVVAVIMCVVGDSLARAFGLGAAGDRRDVNLNTSFDPPPAHRRDLAAGARFSDCHDRALTDGHRSARLPGPLRSC